MTGDISGTIAARLDRLTFSASLKKLVLLISLGGAFEFYDLFMTAYIAPGLIAAHLFSANAAGFFSPNGVGFFIFSTFAGMWAGSVGFGFIADRLGRVTSTVSREVAANGGRDGYRAWRAHQRAAGCARRPRSPSWPAPGWRTRFPSGWSSGGHPRKSRAACGSSSRTIR